MDRTYSRPQAPPALLAPDPIRVPSGRSDAELVAASLRDGEVFTELFERHWTRLRRFCASRAGGAGEDIAAETFRVAFDRRCRYDTDHDDARPWLFGIATYLLRDHFRAAQRDETKHSRAAALDTLAGHEDLGGLEQQLLGPQLTAALGDLPPTDRDALLLLAWADLDYEQIARALDVPLGTVRSRIHRARRRVRDFLDATDADLETRTR